MYFSATQLALCYILQHYILKGVGHLFGQDLMRKYNYKENTKQIDKISSTT